jgi:1-acyl-sn-glycerol-3-phosphate acyltransferase
MTAPAPYVAPRHDSSRWLRRAVTVPGYIFGATATLVFLPFLVALTAAIDLIAPRRFARTRALLMATVYLACEAAGIAIAGALWFRHRGWRSTPAPAYLAANFRLQCWWASTLFRSAVRIFSWRVEVEGIQAAARGPVIVLSRHVSVIDNLIPAALLSAPYQLRLRWAINRSLLRDPCLDIVGHRLPNAFVRGGSSDREGHIEALARLAAGLGSSDGVLLFPEGALFNQARLGRARERLETAHPAIYASARRLENVLPMRLAGLTAVLDAAPAADVVFIAHRGLEAASSYQAFLRESGVGISLTVAVWRVPRADIPTDPEARVQWFLARWEELDRWVGSAVSHPRPAPVEAGAA